MYNNQTAAVSQEQGQKILDSTKTKKFIKFSEKKNASLKLCAFAERTVTLAGLDIDVKGGEVPASPFMTDKTLERIRDCSAWVTFATPENFEKLKKLDGYVCKNAFCPVCMAYQCRRDGLKYSVMMDGAQDLINTDVAARYGVEVAAIPVVRRAIEKGVEYVMLTLTTPNVTGDGLKPEEKKYAKSFNRMVDHWFMREFSEYYLGYIRKLEVTYNKQKLITKEMWEGMGKYNSPWKWKFMRMGLKVGDRNPYYDTYNPHYHVILAVTPDFFYTDGEGKECMKLTREALLEKWRQLMGDPSITQVKVQRVHKTRGEGNSATAEIGKYVAKDSDYLHSPRVFKVFYESLKGVKRVTFGGIFAEMHKLFKADKLDRYFPADETVYKWAVDYVWAGRLYREKDRRELSSEEAAKVAGMKYSEANDTEDF